jgi:hypothetical protein
MRGTIEFNSQKEKVFLPELMCDLFIGVLKPNQRTIDEDCFLITDSKIETKENDIVTAELNYYNKTAVVTGKTAHTQRFKN